MRYFVDSRTETETRTLTHAEAMAELEQAVQYAVKGVRDPEVMRKAGERMDRMREELRQRVGEMEVAVELIREGRDEE